MGDDHDSENTILDNTILDTEWINRYKELEDDYKIFYKSEVKTIELLYYYRTEQNEVEIKKDELELTEKIDEYGYCKKVIPFELLQQFVDKNAISENNKYKLKAVYKYNFLFDTETILNNENAAAVAAAAAAAAAAENTATEEEEEEDDDDDVDVNDIFLTKINLEEKKDVIYEKTIGFFHGLNAIYIIYTL